MANEQKPKATAYIQLVKFDDNSGNIQGVLTPTGTPRKVVQKPYSELSPEQKVIFDMFVTMINNLS